MRRLLGGIGVIAAIAIMVVSASMNARYAMSLGTAETDRYLLAAGALFADVGKALAWLYFMAAVAQRQVLGAVAALAIFLPCLGTAISGSFGFIASQRAATIAQATASRDTLQALQDEVRPKQARRAAIGAAEDVASATARLEASRQHALYERSKQCSAATQPDSRTYCQGLKALEADVAKASEAHKLDAEARAVEHERDVLVICDRRGESVEKRLHSRAVRIGQDQRERVVGAGLDHGVDIGVDVALIDEARRSLAALPPDVAGATFLADARVDA